MESGTKVESVAAKSAALSLLIVDDEVITRNLCNDVALEAGLHVYASSTTEQALDILDQYPIDIVVTDLKIPQLGGLELIKRIRAGNPQVSVIVLTQYGTIETAIEATRLGAVDYFTKPFAAYFFHVNPRHHSVAFIESGKTGIHHLMVETCYLDDVGQGYDIAQKTPEMIACEAMTVAIVARITSGYSAHFGASR